MKNILLSLSLIFSMGAVSNEAVASTTVWCDNSPGICAAIVGQVSGNYNGWSGGCLVIGGTPTYCILR